MYTVWTNGIWPNEENCWYLFDVQLRLLNPNPVKLETSCTVMLPLTYKVSEFYLARYTFLYSFSYLWQLTPNSVDQLMIRSHCSAVLSQCDFLSSFYDEFGKVQIGAYIKSRQNQRPCQLLQMRPNAALPSPYVSSSVTRLVDLLDFWQLFKACGNN